MLEKSDNKLRFIGPIVDLWETPAYRDKFLQEEGH